MSLSAILVRHIFAITSLVKNKKMTTQEVADRLVTKQFGSMIEKRHGGSFSDPLVCGKYFSVSMTLDATFKGIGRNLNEEICIYEVKDGKIVFEQFYF
jgi:hypothetical protein